MLKATSKRRRTRAEIEQDTASKLDEENAIKTKLARLDEMELRMAQYEEQLSQARTLSTLVEDLKSAGVVRQEGDFSFVAKDREGDDQRFQYQNS